MQNHQNSKFKINHEKLDSFSKNPNVSEFQRYYVTESFKAYLGLKSQFIEGLLDIMINERIIPLLISFDILEETEETKN